MEGQVGAIGEGEGGGGASWAGAATHVWTEQPRRQSAHAASFACAASSIHADFAWF